MTFINGHNIDPFLSVSDSQKLYRSRILNLLRPSTLKSWRCCVKADSCVIYFTVIWVQGAEFESKLTASKIVWINQPLTTAQQPILQVTYVSRCEDFGFYSTKCFIRTKIINSQNQTGRGDHSIRVSLGNHLIVPGPMLPCMMGPSESTAVSSMYSHRSIAALLSIVRLCESSHDGEGSWFHSSYYCECVIAESILHPCL